MIGRLSKVEYALPNGAMSDLRHLLAESQRLQNQAVRPLQSAVTDPAVISGIRQNEYNDSLRLQIPFLRRPTVQPATNGIEYVGRRQVRTAEPYQPVDPEHLYGIGRTGNHFGDAPPLETDKNGRAKYFYESDFAKYQLDDVRTDIRYLDLSAYGRQYQNSANSGVQDLVAALQWVKDNAAQFGGDPQNITISANQAAARKY